MAKDLRAKAIKVLTKKLEREPTEKEIAKKVKKLEAKAAAGDDESPKKEKKKSKKEKKEKKRKAESESDEEEESPKKAKVEEAPAAAAAAAPAGAANPDQLSKCFLGNLSYDIDDDQAKEYFKDCGGEITDIYWLTDKETGKFFGSGFITFSTPEAAAAAVAKAGQELLGRPLKIEFAKPKPGGDTPRKKKTYESKPLSEKPEGCLTVFCGNLSYDIDDDSCKAFFKDCGEIAKIRWLTDRESGDFKGCGFVEFYETESTDKAIALNGQDCLGRSIRLDYAAAKKKEW
jgi:nucleolin